MDAVEGGEDIPGAWERAGDEWTADGYLDYSDIFAQTRDWDRSDR